MSEYGEELTDAQRKKVLEHSRRFTKWLREWIRSDAQQSAEAKEPAPRKAA